MANEQVEKQDRYPTPAEVRAARLETGLTLKEAAALIHTELRCWAQYETDPSNQSYRKMHPAFWELATIKMDKIKKKKRAKEKKPA